MAAARLDLPAVFVYGGIDPSRPARRPGPRHRERLRGGRRERRRDDHGRGALADRAQRVPDRGIVRRDVHRQHDGVGGRGARDVASRSASRAGGRPPARRPRHELGRGGHPTLASSGITPRQIMTKQAFENAIAVVMALGGSTNAVLHLLAIAHEARVDLDARRLQRSCGPRSRTSPT